MNKREEARLRLVIQDISAALTAFESVRAVTEDEAERADLNLAIKAIEVAESMARLMVNSHGGESK